MVLQQEPKKSTVWGYADDTQIGQTAKVSIANELGYIKTYEVTVSKG